MAAFNFLVLQDPVSFEAVIRTLRRRGAAWRVALFIGLLMVATAAVIALVVGSRGSLLTGGGAFLALLFAGGVWVIDDVVRQAVQQVRLERFASSNGCALIADDLAPDHPGSVFARRSMRIASALRTAGPAFIEWGNMRVVGTQERSSSGPTFGFLRVRLARKDWPHLLLIGPWRFRYMPADRTVQVGTREVGGRTFSLRGDDVLEGVDPRVLGADAIARCQAVFGDFVAELIGDELYVYAKRRIRMEDADQTMDVVSSAEQLRAWLDHAQPRATADAPATSTPLGPVDHRATQGRSGTPLAWYAFGAVWIAVTAVAVVVHAASHLDSPGGRMAISLLVAGAVASIITFVKTFVRRRR